ncbi:MAG: M20/M25/M40 family metallo-hydrolase [Opitutaceae bacterium]
MISPASRLRRLLAPLAVVFALSAAAVAATPEETRARELIASPQFQAVVAAYERDFDRFVAELIQLTEIPAPPFGEKARGEAFARLLREAGIEDISTDAEGNVIGVRRGRGQGPLLGVAAHLDTVFPAGTDVRVKRSGTRLIAPGVGDDTRGLAFVLAFTRAIREAKIETPGDMLIIGNVGEEGQGDLRGMRYLFTRGPWRGRIARFISVDGGNLDVVTNGGLGSLRYRVTFKGPGGHSWGAFGQVNPAFALGNAMAKLGKVVVPKRPKVSYNVGVVSGGTSVNSIPFEVAMEVDMRSASPEELRKIDAEFKRIVAEAVEEENAARQTTFGRVTVELRLIGERPSGTTPPDSPIARQIAGTMQVFDKVPVWETSSTDANIPISLGIPAVAIARNSANKGGLGHSLDEWTDVEKTQAVKDFTLAAAIILGVATMP